MIEPLCSSGVFYGGVTDIKTCCGQYVCVLETYLGHLLRWKKLGQTRRPSFTPTLPLKWCTSLRHPRTASFRLLCLSASPFHDLKPQLYLFHSWKVILLRIKTDHHIQTKQYLSHLRTGRLPDFSPQLQDFVAIFMCYFLPFQPPAALHFTLSRASATSCCCSFGVRDSGKANSSFKFR